MATATASGGPQVVVAQSSQHTSAGQPTACQKAAYFDLSISLILSSWPALSTAVTNSWGGPDSSGKRDWFVGAISDLFASSPSTDQEDLECVLLQVMEDEFEARLEDESEVDIAGEILRMRRWCERGDFGEIDEMQRRWEQRRGRNETGIGQGASVDEDDDDESEDDDSDGGVEVADEDVEMGEATDIVKSKEKTEPEIDEEGFTKVTGKKKR